MNTPCLQPNSVSDCEILSIDRIRLKEPFTEKYNTIHIIRRGSIWFSTKHWPEDVWMLILFLTAFQFQLTRAKDKIWKLTRAAVLLWMRMSTLLWWHKSLSSFPPLTADEGKINTNFLPAGCVWPLKIINECIYIYILWNLFWEHLQELHIILACIPEWRINI